ncbi:unnamed protein product [Brugia timori]|uniref:Glycosaminoglycan xylosylkinase n=1 Tax=Brugia timori TaxID=42155 RepID=A0A0R3Q5I2_9BILA|nr:unnamed protein product [Brugia timori]
MSIPRSRNSILWLGFILVITPRYKNVDAHRAEEFILNKQQLLDNQIRSFPPRSQAIQVQSNLHYGRKPLWPLQWYMTEEILTVNGLDYSPSMKIAEMHLKGIKGDGLGVVIIGNTPVNCQHVAIHGRCVSHTSLLHLSSSFCYSEKKLILR